MKKWMLILVFVAGAAIAAPVVTTSASEGPSWKWVVGTAVAIASALALNYIRGLERRLLALEHDGTALKERVLTQYHDAADTERMIRSELQPVHISVAHIQSSVEAIHLRLDRMQVPSVYSPARGELNAS